MKLDNLRKAIVFPFRTESPLLPYRNYPHEGSAVLDTLPVIVFCSLMGLVLSLINEATEQEYIFFLK